MSRPLDTFGDWTGWEITEVIENIGETRYKERALQVLPTPAKALTEPTCKEVDVAAERLCSVDGCGKPYISRGYCDKHYRRYMKHGDPLLGAARYGEPMRFLVEVAIPFTGTDCLDWPYAKNPAGYGKLWIDGKCEHAHRYVCKQVHGEPPSATHEAAHDCGKGHLGCCNPMHLSWKTPKENQRDRIAHGTHLRGEDAPRARLTEADVRRIRRLLPAMSDREISEQIGVPPSTIWNIRSGHRWAWLS